MGALFDFLVLSLELAVLAVLAHFFYLVAYHPRRAYLLADREHIISYIHLFIVFAGVTCLIYGAADFWLSWVARQWHFRHDAQNILAIIFMILAFVSGLSVVMCIEKVLKQLLQMQERADHPD